MTIRLTESRLRNIIRSVINESTEGENASSSSDRAYFLPSESLGKKLASLNSSMTGLAYVFCIKMLFEVNKKLEEGTVSIVDKSGKDVTADFARGGKYAGKRIHCDFTVKDLNGSKTSLNVIADVEGRSTQLTIDFDY